MRRDIRRALNDSERDAKASGRRMGEQMGKEAGASFARELKIGLGAIGVGNLPAVASALGTVASSLQQVAQAGAVMPGVIATAGASIGTLKLATQGLGDAFKEMWKAAESGDPKDIKKAAEAMKDMEPNAKAALTAVAGFHDQFKKLQNTARGNVFANLDSDITRLGNRTLPTLTAGMDKTSRAWNNTLRELARVGSTGSTQSLLDRIFGNTADAQNRSNAAIAPLVNAFGTLAAVGSDSVPRLGSALGDLATRFNAFITAAGSDGRLNKWINDGLTGTTHLGRTMLGIGQSFTALTKAAGGGEGLLGALDKGSNALARFMNSADGQAKLSKFFEQGREQLKSWEPILGALPSLFGGVYDASRAWSSAVLPPISQLARLLAEHTGIVKTAALAWLAFKTVPTIMGRIGTAFAPINTGLATVRSQVTTTSTHIGARMASIVGDFRNLGNAAPHLSATSRALTSLTNNSQTFRQMTNAFIGAPTVIGGATSALRILGTTAAGSVASAVGGTLRSAVGGVVGALGGPFTAALIGAGVAFSVISQKNEAASRSLKNYQDAVTNTGRAQVILNEALMKSRGANTDEVKAASVGRIQALEQELKAASERTGSFLDKYRKAGTHGIWDALRGVSGTGGSEDEQIKRQADAARDAMKALDDLKISQQSLSDVTTGAQAPFDAMVAKLEAAGDGGRDAANKMRQARSEFLQVQGAAANTAPGVYEMSKAMRTLADNTASAADKTNALKTAMDAMNPAVSKFEAEAQHTRAVDAAKSQAETPVDQSKGFGDNLFGADGAASGSNVNSVALGEQLKAVRDGTTAMAQSGADMTKALADNEQLFADLAARYGTSVEKIRAAYDAFGGKLADASGKIGELAKLVQTGAIPTNTEIKVNTPGGDQALTLLKAIGEKVHADNDKSIHVDAPLGEQTKQLLKDLGYEVRTNNDKLILVKADTTQAENQLSALASKFGSRTITLPVAAAPASGSAPATVPGRLFGAIAMAEGGLRWMRKPQTAGLYAGRGAGTVFAEEETGGEAYIPLAPSKRPRSLAILAEVARRFGVMADGGITVDSLKQFAQGIAGRVYKWGAGNGDTFDTDCSGAQATVANFITGASGRFSTASESSALLARGFQAGDPPPGIAAYWVGWDNGGPGGGHTAGTIIDPDGGNVNVEMGGKNGGGQFGGGAAGATAFGNRAWIALASGDDPTKSGGGSSAVKSAQASVTSAKASTTSAQNSVDKAQKELDDLKAKGASQDKITASEKKLDVAQQKLTAAQERQSAAETRLAEVKDKEATKAGQAGDGGGKSFGEGLASGLFGGLMQSIGLPGFANLLDSPNVKSLQALANAFSGPLKGAMEGKLGIQQPGWVPGMPIDTGDGNTTTVGLPGGGGGALPSIGLPGVGDFMKPIPEAGLDPMTHQGSGAAPGPAGPTFSYTMNGTDPKVALQKSDAHFNQSWRSSGMAAVKP